MEQEYDWKKTDSKEFYVNKQMKEFEKEIYPLSGSQLLQLSKDKFGVTLTNTTGKEHSPKSKKWILTDIREVARKHFEAEAIELEQAEKDQLDLEAAEGPKHSPDLEDIAATRPEDIDSPADMECCEECGDFNGDWSEDQVKTEDPHHPGNYPQDDAPDICNDVPDHTDLNELSEATGEGASLTYAPDTDVIINYTTKFDLQCQIEKLTGIIIDYNIFTCHSRLIARAKQALEKVGFERIVIKRK